MPNDTTLTAAWNPVCGVGAVSPWMSKRIVLPENKASEQKQFGCDKLMT